MNTLFVLVLTLIINGEEYTTTPAVFYSMDDCVEALKELDKQHPTANQLFKCEEIED